MPVFLGYDQTERMIAALLDRAAQWQPDTVVGIARGGLVPATMAAGILALPLAMIGYERSSGASQWIGAPAAGSRVLLVDDGCSTGRTMEAVRADAAARGPRLPDPRCGARSRGDVATCPTCRIRCGRCGGFPWERGEATPAGRALRATGAGPDRSTELPFYGLDLDGVFLPDVPDAVYHADIAEAVLRRHGLEPFPHSALLLARARRGDHRPARRRIASALRRGWHVGDTARCLSNVARPTCRTIRIRSRATRPRLRRAGAARISSKATPSRRCASLRTRRIWW